MVLVRKVFEATANIPARDRYTLAAQMRRSAISVPSNIAEGAARGSNAEYARFLLIARGSLMELDTQLWIARDLGLLPNDESIHQRLNRLGAQLNALIESKRKS